VTAFGRPVFPSVRRDRTVLHLSILSAVLFMPFGLYLPYFPVWLKARGLSESDLAIVIATPIALRVLLTPLIATFADKHGIALTLAACAIAMCAAYAGLGFVETFPQIFIGAAIAALAMGMLPSLSDALTLSEVRRVETAGHGRVSYSHIRAWTPAGVLVTMLLSGEIVSLLPGTKIIYALAAMAALPAFVAIIAAAHLQGHAHHARAGEGRLAAGAAELRLAMAGIGAAALIQSSHAEVYSFGTLHWTLAGLSPNFISLAWAIGVGAETLFFLATARFLASEKNAIAFLVAGGVGAILRWVAMSANPAPWQILSLQAMHGLSFAATYLGSVLLLASLAGPTHRARMQGFLASASALALAGATFTAGRLMGILGETNYLLMAGLASAGLTLALVAGFLKRDLEHRVR
jgi:PPP family 3-phenylpropionic acid transporter